jgi:phospholipid transport system substrate-binding protein
MTSLAFLHSAPARAWRGARAALLVVVLSLGGASAALAETFPAEPGPFIKAVADYAIDEILTPEIPTAARVEKFETLLDEAFDLQTVARFVVGRAWRDASEAEHERFLELFRDFNVYNWSSQFDEYGGEKLNVSKVIPDSDKGYFIETEIGNPNGKPFVVTWRVRKRDSGLRIIDISVEGVWMSQTWRSEYSTVVKQQGGLAGLNETLADRVAELRAESDL